MKTNKLKKESVLFERTFDIIKRICLYNSPISPFVLEILRFV